MARRNQSDGRSDSYEALTGSERDGQQTEVTQIMSYESTRVSKEGFEALVTLAEKPYHIRVMATAKKSSEQEERRVWRVLYWPQPTVFDWSSAPIRAWLR
jgi:hypothetical protein